MPELPNKHLLQRSRGAPLLRSPSSTGVNPVYTMGLAFLNRFYS